MRRGWHVGTASGHITPVGGPGGDRSTGAADPSGARVPVLGFRQGQVLVGLGMGRRVALGGGAVIPIRASRLEPALGESVYTVPVRELMFACARAGQVIVATALAVTLHRLGQLVTAVTAGGLLLLLLGRLLLREAVGRVTGRIGAATVGRRREGGVP